ncbi:unnamed protein product, partial [Aureobasidium uvarum]
KLKITVKDLVTRIKRKLNDSSSNIRASSTASPATQLEQDAIARARLPSTTPATERMSLDK